MSREARDWAWAVRGLKMGERVVLLRLADRVHAGDNIAWPSVESVALDCEMGATTVRRALRGLEAGGWLRLERPGGGFRVTAVYALAMPGYPAEVAGLFDQYPARSVTNTRPDRCNTRPDRPNYPADLAGESFKEPIKNPEKRIAHAAACAAVVEPAGFGDFWSSYPRHVARSRAEAAYRQAAKRDGPDAIASGLAAWCSWWQAKATEVEFIPHPTTFLRQARYLDRPPTPRPAEPRGWATLRAVARNQGVEL